MEHHLVLRVIAKLLIPLILIFALYVQFHGDYGPGGGFQAGVIFASAFILYSLIFGVENARSVISFNLLRVISALGLLLYIAVGVVALTSGGNFLDYNVLLSDPVHGQHLGILVIEFGVGMIVAAVMMMIFFVFARP
jgi:multicomponent Na+:H+ antiporter subunit B